MESNLIKISDFNSKNSTRDVPIETGKGGRIRLGDIVQKNFFNISLGLGIGYLSSKTPGVPAYVQSSIAVMLYGGTLAARTPFNQFKYGLSNTEAARKCIGADVITGIAAAAGFTLGKLENVVVPIVQSWIS